MNEQTLTFVPKLAVIALVLVVFGASMLGLVSDLRRTYSCKSRKSAVNLAGIPLVAVEAELLRLLFLMVRIGAAFLAAPIFGATSVPVQVRLVLSGAIAVFVAVWVPVMTRPPCCRSKACWQFSARSRSAWRSASCCNCHSRLR